MLTQSLKTFAALSAIVLVATGCGSSSGESAPTKAQFILQADAICRESDKVQVAALGRANAQKPLEQRSKAEQDTVIVTVGLAPVRKEAKELSELTPPDGDEGEINAIVEGIEKAVQEAEKDPAAVTGAAPNPFESVDKLSAKYGFKVCSEAL